MDISTAILALVLFMLPIAMIARMFDVSLDWTKQKELLMWYSTRNEEGIITRGFVKIFKL